MTTVVIRTINSEDYIEKCLDALALQKSRPEEVLIVDNLSSDSTKEKSARYKKKLNLKIVDNHIKGYAEGLNIGYKIAKTKYVAFISADCIPKKTWLYWLEKTAESNRADSVHGNDLGYPPSDIHFVINTEIMSSSNKATKVSYFNNTNVLHKRETLKKYGPFIGVGPLYFGEDTVMSVIYQRHSLRMFYEPRAVVLHEKFPDYSQFKRRMLVHGEASLHFLKMFPLKPRLYLNSVYWGIKEVGLSMRRRDARFFKVGVIRLLWTFLGMLKAVTSRNKSLG